MNHSPDQGFASRCRTKLDTLPRVEKELRCLYRSAKSGRTPIADAKVLAGILLILCRVREVGTLEERLVALEALDREHA